MLSRLNRWDRWDLLRVGAVLAGLAVWFLVPKGLHSGDFLTVCFVGSLCAVDWLRDGLVEPRSPAEQYFPRLFFFLWVALVVLTGVRAV
jgi:hypothetical protein